MATATIVLEDDQQPNGAPGVSCKLVFAGGFDKSSHAHQHAQILIGLMDQHMQRAGAAVIDPAVQAIAGGTPPADVLPEAVRQANDVIAMANL